MRFASCSAQKMPFMMPDTVGTLTAYFLASAAKVIPADRSPRSSLARSSVSFFAQAGLVTAAKRPWPLACSMFALRVAHSMLVAQLFVLSRSRWFTSALGNVAGGRKANATSRCTLAFRETPSALRLTTRYPSLSLMGVSIFPRLKETPPPQWRTSRSKLRTRPSELTSYCDSYPATDFQRSMLEILTGFDAAATSRS